MIAAYDPGEDSGDGGERITLPPDACCKRCDFSRLSQPDPGSLTRTRFCKRFPPPALLFAGPEGRAGVVTVNRPVQDSDFCYEYQERQVPEIEPIAFIGGAN